MKRYLIQVFGLLAAILAGLLGMSLAADPYGLWGTRLVPPRLFPPGTRLMLGDDRVVKGLELLRAAPAVVFTGSSRTLIGLDPASPVLRGAAYDAGFAGAAADEITRVARFALRGPRVERIVWGFNFELFLRGAADEAELARSVFGGGGPREGLARATLARDAVAGAWTALRRAALGRPVPATLRTDGAMIAPPPEAEFETRAKFEADLAFFARTVAPAIPRDPAAYADAFERVAAVVRAARARGVAVDLVVEPMHAWRFEAYRLTGLLPAYASWREALARIAREAGAAPGTGRVRLFDAAPGPALARPVPPGRIALRDGPGFHESSHFLPRVGEALLAAMAEGAPPDASFPELRGEAEAAAVRLDAGLSAWREARPEEAALVARIVAGARGGGRTP